MAKAKSQADNTPANFYALAPKAIAAGLLDEVNQLVHGPGSWADKITRLQAIMA